MNICSLGQFSYSLASTMISVQLLSKSTFLVLSYGLSTVLSKWVGYNRLGIFQSPQNYYCTKNIHYFFLSPKQLPLSIFLLHSCYLCVVYHLRLPGPEIFSRAPFNFHLSCVICPHIPVNLSLECV